MNLIKELFAVARTKYGGQIVTDGIKTTLELTLPGLDKLSLTYTDTSDVMVCCCHADGTDIEIPQYGFAFISKSRATRYKDLTAILIHLTGALQYIPAMNKLVDLDLTEGLNPVHPPVYDYGIYDDVEFKLELDHRFKDTDISLMHTDSITALMVPWDNTQLVIRVNWKHPMVSIERDGVVVCELLNHLPSINDILTISVKLLIPLTVGLNHIGCVAPNMTEVLEFKNKLNGLVVPMDEFVELTSNQPYNG